MVTRSSLVLVVAIAGGGLVSHGTPGVRKPLLTPLVLCAAACAGGRVFAGNGVPAERSRRSVASWLGAVAAAGCLGAYLGEGWREYRRVVWEVTAPVDPLTAAARAAAEVPPRQAPETAKLIDQMNAGLALREAQHRERGSLVDYTRGRWRNVGAVALLPRTRPATLSLLAAECLLAWGLGVWLGSLIAPGASRSSPGREVAGSPPLD